jgi:hypothetical protein
MSGPHSSVFTLMTLYPLKMTSAYQFQSVLKIVMFGQAG